MIVFKNVSVGVILEIRGSGLVKVWETSAFSICEIKK